MALEIEPNGRFGVAMADAMQSKGVDNLRDLAAKVDSTYEHMRKLIKGMAYPSKHLLRTLCDVLDLKLSEMEKLVFADRIQHKYGKLPHLLSGKNPELDPIEKDWDALTDDQKEAAKVMIHAWATQNRRREKP